jgi:hypothetical protein
MKRSFFALALTLTIACSAQAQVFIQPYPTPGWNPWAGGVIYPPQYPGIQYLGQLPNGTPVFNPWNMYQNLNNQRPIYYQSPYFVPFFYPQFFWNYYGYNPYGYGMSSNAGIINVPGRFVPVGPDLAVNPFNGVTLAPRRGYAQTPEGTFYRAPGSGSFTAWGAYIPGSGVFVNPMNGDTYQPNQGLLIRR